MRAVLDADVGVVKLLLSKGADANTPNKKGATALLWALHDPDKVKLLLDHGAKIPEEAVFAAAAIPGGSRTLPRRQPHGRQGWLYAVGRRNA
jgi:hypothetical protein